MTREELDAALIAAHEAGDAARIADLFADAGDRADALEEACFFWTQAYIWALDAGSPLAERMRSELVAHGREQI